FAADRDEYRALVTGADPTPWVRYFLECVRAQAVEDERWALRLFQVQLSTRHRLGEHHASRSALAAADVLLTTPYLSASMLAPALGVSGPTARLAIEQLVERGELVEMSGRRRDRYYLAPAMFDEVYGQLASAPSAARPEGG
ncbi:MAG: hypothetical protein ACRDWN_04610, partial [Acidimicrobiales bacterium]